MEYIWIKASIKFMDVNKIEILVGQILEGILQYTWSVWGDFFFSQCALTWMYCGTVKPHPEAHMDMIIFEVFLKSINLIPQQQILQRH